MHRVIELWLRWFSRWVSVSAAAAAAAAAAASASGTVMAVTTPVYLRASVSTEHWVLLHTRSQWRAIGQNPTYTHTLSHSDDKSIAAVRLWTRRATGETTCLNANPLVKQKRNWIIPLALTSIRVIGCVPIQALRSWKYTIWGHWRHGTALSPSQFTEHWSIVEMRP